MSRCPICDWELEWLRRVGYDVVKDYVLRNMPMTLCRQCGQQFVGGSGILCPRCVERGRGKTMLFASLYGAAGDLPYPPW